MSSLQDLIEGGMCTGGLVARSSLLHIPALFSRTGSERRFRREYYSGFLPPRLRLLRRFF